MYRLFFKPNPNAQRHQIKAALFIHEKWKKEVEDENLD